MKARKWFIILMGGTGLLLLFYSCNVTLEIKDGQTAYDLKKYSLATELLIEEYEKAKDKEDKFDISKKIAESYLAYSKTLQAESWFKKAVDHDVDPNILFNYAMVLKQNEKYTEAIETLNLFYQYDRNQRLIVEGHTSACEEIMALKEEETHTKISNLAGINSKYSEFAPTFFEGLLIYSSNSPVEGVANDEWTGDGYANILSAIALTKENFQPNEDWDVPYNTSVHEAVLSMNETQDEKYFTRCGKEDDNKDVCQIYRSFKEFDEWTDPEQVILFDDSTNVGHPFISADGKQLYFSSDATFGYGGKDLYVSNRIGEEWDSPVNLGPRVNTARDEMFPYISKEGKLYFASDGHYGYGGLDIFVAEKRGRIFTGLQQLPYPLNTGGDDFSIYLMESEDDSVEITGYMASNRNGGIGSDDLYYFEKRLAPAIKLPPPVYVLEGLVEEKVFENPKDPNSNVTGKQPLPGVSIELIDNTDPLRPYLNADLTSDAQGMFETYLDAELLYKLNLSKKGYFTVNAEVSTQDLNAEDGDTIVISRTMMLDKIYKEIEFTINNIYYDLDSANIREDAALVLDSLATILLQNPTLRVELGSHTDSRGSDGYNLDLSQRRANSAVAYLISEGISTGRLIAKGYGETRLVNECANDVACTEEKHQENRRTTFKVIGLDFQIDSGE